MTCLLVLDAFGVGGHSVGVRVEVEARAEPLPQSFAADRDLHGAVGGAEQPVRADRRMVVALRLADLAGDGPLRALEGVHADDAGQQRRSHDAAPSGALAFLQGGDDAERAVHAGEQVGDGNADALDVVGSGAGQRHQSGLALRDLVVPGASAFGSVVTETADGQDDQPRVELGEPFGRESQAVEDAGAEVLHEDVGAPHEGFEGARPSSALEVEGDRLLVPVRGQEVGRFALGVRGLHEGRPPAAGVVAAAAGSPP